MTTTTKLLLRAVLLLAVSAAQAENLDFLDGYLPPVEEPVAQAQDLDFLGGYLPPVEEPTNTCENVISTSIEMATSVTRVLQPFTMAVTRMAVAEALVTEVHAVTTTMEVIESRQVLIPVTATYEQVAQAVRTALAEAFFTPEAVVSQVLETEVVPSTRVEQVVMTRLEEVVDLVSVTETQVTTSFAKAYGWETVTKTQSETSVFTPPAVLSTQLETEVLMSTELATPLAITSTVEEVVMQTEEAVEFVSVDPIFVTSVVTETDLMTKYEDITRTSQVQSTVTTTRTEEVLLTETQTEYVTSTAVVEELVLETSTLVLQKEELQTQVEEVVVTSTSVVDMVEEVLVESTVVKTVAAYVEVTGAPVIESSLVTATVMKEELVQQTVDEVIPITITRTVSASCSSSGYDYPAPATRLLFG